jgi:multicomponent Na+:H+ antiporter subunit B
MIGPVAYLLVAFVLATAVATALLRDVLAVIIVFAAYSLGMALLYTLLLAPDVGLTEAVIGAGVTTILLLLTIAKTVRPTDDRTFERPDPRALVACGALAVVFGLTLPELPAVGDPTAAVVSYEPVTGYYLTESYAETGVENTVTAVLAAYRGFDTFGEATVVFGAGVAVLVVLRREVFT